MRVLVVDDNQDITELVSKFLTAKGFENIITNDPREGLNLIKSEHFDAVLLDIAMPEFCGRDIISALEKENILKDQKIIIFSAHAFGEAEINDLLEKDGIQSIMKKPIQLGRLLTAIAN